MLADVYADCVPHTSSGLCNGYFAIFLLIYAFYKDRMYLLLFELFSYDRKFAWRDRVWLFSWA